MFIIFRRFGTKMDYSLVPKLTGTCKLNHISLQKYFASRGKLVKFLAGAEIGFSRYHGNPIEGPLETPQTITTLPY